VFSQLHTFRFVWQLVNVQLNFVCLELIVPLQTLLRKRLYLLGPGWLGSCVVKEEFVVELAQTCSYTFLLIPAICDSRCNSTLLRRLLFIEVRLWLQLLHSIFMALAILSFLAVVPVCFIALWQLLVKHPLLAVSDGHPLVAHLL
jgi:hypothetical protein